MSDNATEENPDIVNSRKYEVTFDFEFLEDWRPHETKLVDSNTVRRNTWGHIAPRELTGATSKKQFELGGSLVNSHHSAEDDEEHSAKWKPEGFSKRYHPLHRMVSLLYSMH